MQVDVRDLEALKKREGRDTDDAMREESSLSDTMKAVGSGKVEMTTSYLPIPEYGMKHRSLEMNEVFKSSPDSHPTTIQWHGIDIIHARY